MLSLGQVTSSLCLSVLCHLMGLTRPTRKARGVTGGGHQQMYFFLISVVTQEGRGRSLNSTENVPLIQCFELIPAAALPVPAGVERLSLRRLQRPACLHSLPVLSALCLRLCGTYIYSTCEQCPAVAGLPRGTRDLPKVILQPVHGQGSVLPCSLQPCLQILCLALPLPGGHC